MSATSYLKDNESLLEQATLDGLTELLKKQSNTPLRFMSEHFAKMSAKEGEEAPDVGWSSEGSAPEYVGRVTSAAKAAAEKHKQKHEQKATNEPVWDAQAWLAAEGCANKLEQVLLGPLKKILKIDPSENVGTVELELIRAIANEKDRRAVVMSLLEHSNAMQQLADFFSEKMDKLLGAAAESGRALNAKFVEEYHSDQMAFGGQESFFKGLDGIIGPPNPNLQEGMRSEHCERKDSSNPFVSSNYQITTTSHVEFLMVVEPLSIFPEPKPQYQTLKLPSDIQKLKDAGKLVRRPSSPVPELKLGPDEDRVGMRLPKPPSAFGPKLAAIVEQLEDRDLAKLQLEEFHAARLYTGPMFMKYNAVLRGLPKLVDYLFKRMEELCQDNQYVTTLHCINSAIVKLGRLAKPQTVYRGISGRVLPAQFWRGAGHGGVEFAFMSTTTDRNVAMQYAKTRDTEEKAATVMEIHMGMIDRGADLAWLSQYPEEHEITFTPFTGLEVANTRVDENVLVVNMRLNVNLMSPTIESSVAKMRSAHLQLLETVHSNLRTAHAPSRLLLSLKGLFGAEKGKEPNHFNRVENFHAATEMALDTQREAFITLHETTLWDREFKDIPEDIPEKMRMAAQICARVGEHEVALSLLRQAWDRDHPVDTKSFDYRGQMILAKSSVFWQSEELSRLDNELNEIIKEHLNDVRDDEKWKLALAVRLVQIGMPSPWPATLCRLATATDVTESTSELSESLATSDKTRDAIIEVIKAALTKQLAADEFKFGEPVGLKGLSKGAHVRVLVTSQVGDAKSQVWRKAKAESTRYDGLIAKEGAAGRTITVDAPKGDQPPTITLKPSYTYEVQWTSATAPQPGEYVISELADGGKYGEVKLARKAGSEVVGSFSNPTEGYLKVALREGSGKPDYSASDIARGEVLISPAPNPIVSSGAGAVLREAAATGNVKLLQALLDVGVSVWEADPTATTAVHLAARNRQEETFGLLWKVEPKGEPLRVKLVKPTLVHLTLRNNDYKRALDFIFESGSSKLARMTRPDALDEEMKLLEDTDHAALKWTDELLEVERKAIGENSSEVPLPSPRSRRALPLPLQRSDSSVAAAFRSPEDREVLISIAGKATDGGVTALMLACRLDDLGDAYACVRALLIAKADPARPTKKNKLTALHIAAEMGHHAIVEMLARSLGPGNVDLRLNDGKTALMLACKNGFAEVAAELLNFGADPNLQESNDADGFSAIMHAALYGHHECIAVVLRHVKKKVVEVEADLLQRVSLHSNKRGSLAPAVQTRNKNGDTALHLASLFGQRKVVQLLLRERADVNALNEKGETALHNASKNSHAQVACALMTGGAEVNTQDRDHGYAALHYCCISNGGKDVADALMEVGAEVDLVGMDGNTPLHLACMSGNHGVVDAMMKRKAAFKAAVAVRNKSGEFPFNAAAKAGHNNVKEKLQPIRHTLESHLTRIDSVQQFKKARAFVRDYSVQRLKHELIAPGFVDPKTNRLTTTLAPVNVFALVGAGHPKFQANKDDNEALKKANPAYAEQFMVARNMPANDASWNSDDPAHVGKASMSKRHRFMIIKQPSGDNDKRPTELAPDDARMTYFWTWFNVLTMGLVDGLPDNAVNYDEGELKSQEADPERNQRTLKEALQCLTMMRDAALAFVEQDREENGWSQNIGLFFHCYPFCSVNSTHMHIVDLDYTGPTFDKINNKEGRNLRMEDVIKAVKDEIEVFSKAA